MCVKDSWNPLSDVYITSNLSRFHCLLFKLGLRKSSIFAKQPPIVHIVIFLMIVMIITWIWCWYYSYLMLRCKQCVHVCFCLSSTFFCTALLACFFSSILKFEQYIHSTYIVLFVQRLRCWCPNISSNENLTYHLNRIIISMNFAITISFCSSFGFYRIYVFHLKFEISAFVFSLLAECF